MIVIPIDSMEDTARLKKAYALGGDEGCLLLSFFHSIIIIISCILLSLSLDY